LWYFNQDSVDTDVIDQMGNGANQTSRIGTAVITGDDPPGFSFATSMPVSGSGEGSLSANLAPFDQQNTGYTRGDSTALSAWMRRGETPLVIANPGFEIDTSGWFVDGGTLQRATAQFNSGTASGLIVPDGVTATVESGLTTGASPSVVEGVAYTASIWAYSATGHPFRLVIQWEDGGGSGVGSDVGDTVDPLPETWTLISVSGRAPSGAATVSPRIRVTGTPTGDDLLYIDDMSVSTDDLVLLDSPLIA
jgi:hypothetical protein